jgi:hypothetical protein
MQQRHAEPALYMGMVRQSTRDGFSRCAMPTPCRSRSGRSQCLLQKIRTAPLYREIARANGKPEWENDIRNTFAQRWIDKAQGGWYYQNNAGAWTRK